jgi:hypothetical protein
LCGERRDAGTRVNARQCNTKRRSGVSPDTAQFVLGSYVLCYPVAHNNNQSIPLLSGIATTGFRTKLAGGGVCRPGHLLVLFTGRPNITNATTTTTANVASNVATNTNGILDSL